jgi:hypothetical protein
MQIYMGFSSFSLDFKQHPARPDDPQHQTIFRINPIPKSADSSLHSIASPEVVMCQANIQGDSPATGAPATGSQTTDSSALCSRE